MGDPFKKVHPGEKLRIPAVAYNRLMDVARDRQARKRDIGGQAGIGTPPPGVILTG